MLLRLGKRAIKSIREDVPQVGLQEGEDDGGKGRVRREGISLPVPGVLLGKGSSGGL